MPSNLTADDFKAVEEHLRKEYFLVRSQVVWLVVGLFIAAGIGTGYAGYTATKAAAATEAEKIAKAESEKVAKAVVADTPAKVATDEIIRLKKTAEQETGEIVKRKKDTEDALQHIRNKREESDKIVAGLAPELKRLFDIKVHRIEVLDSWFGEPGSDEGWKGRHGADWQTEKARWDAFRKGHGEYKSNIIKFNKPFQEPPVVYLSFGRNDQTNQVIPVSMSLKACDVTREGFRICLSKFSATELGNCEVNILVAGR
jgi:hypothetical protein